MRIVASRAEVAPGVFYLGELGSPPVVSLYLIRGERTALIEAGPSNTVPQVEATLHDVGVTSEALDYVIVTHVHLDHAGGLWRLLPRFPAAKGVVSQRGLRHLIDPTRLRASAAGIVGRAMQLWGPIEPVPPDRLLAVVDGAKLDLGDRQLHFLATQGHAPHHLSVYDPSTRSVFTGDAVGIYYRQFQALQPATPPPSFDYETALADLRRLGSLGASRWLLPHFGLVSNIDEMLALNLRRYDDWHQFFHRKDPLHTDPQAAAQELTRRFPEYAEVVTDEYRYGSFMIDVVGFLDFFRRHPAKP